MYRSTRRSPVPVIEPTDVIPMPDRSRRLSSLEEVRRDIRESGDEYIDAVLQRITEYALSLTGASGAAVAFLTDDKMICRARAGEPTPSLGAPVDVKQGLSGECVRSGLLVSCEATENDPRIDAEVSRALGIGSLMAAPIVFDFRVAGLLEVFSPQPRAFTKAHATVLERLVEMIPRSPSEKGWPESAQPETPTNPEVVLDVSRPPASELGSNHAAGDALWQQKPEVAAQLSQKVPEQVPEAVPEPAPAGWFQLFHWALLWPVAAVVATVVGYLVGSMFTRR